ncbi:MAG: trypsin-like peptidase domain-containing protein [Clostridia bacterium]|nr:trypsin-like peptidase domain-containing protein [Clostridia bacterium]
MEGFNSENRNGYVPSQDQADPGYRGQPYGAVYTPDSGSGEYHYTPYRGTQTENVYAGGQQSAATQAAKKKKGGKAGMIIGISAAVLVVFLLISAMAVGVMFAAKKLFPNAGNLSGKQGGVPESTLDYSSSTVSVSDRKGSEGQGLITTAVTPGKLMTKAETVSVVKDSVVEITTETVKGGSGMFSQYVVSGAGSGVIISDSGIIITNNHVIEGATKISVRLTDGTEFEASLTGTDEDADIAVITIDPGDKKLTAAVLGNSDLLVAGQEIIVIGNPLGELGGTVTNGIISATEREIEVDNNGTMTLLQTDAAVNPGNSGGGMFNLYGELVGIVNAKSSGDSIEGLGFAIPVNTAWSVADELIKYGYVKGRTTLNITVVDVTNSMYARYYFDSSSVGVYVVEADSGSDFKYGDRIISFDGTEIDSASDLSTQLRKHAVGDSVNVVVMRKGKTVEINVKLSEQVPENKS